MQRCWMQSKSRHVRLLRSVWVRRCATATTKTPAANATATTRALTDEARARDGDDDDGGVPQTTHEAPASDNPWRHFQAFGSMDEYMDVTLIHYDNNNKDKDKDKPK